jgi:hypothetical protein
MLGSNRSPDECQQRIKQLSNIQDLKGINIIKKPSSNTWTTKEDKHLLDIIEKNGCNWKLIK